MNDRPPLLLAHDLGYTVADDGAVIPTVVVDVAGHPEIGDLARVHAIEGVGDIATTARRVAGAGPDGDDVFLLGVSLTSPVRAAFAIGFPLPDAEALLLDAAEAARLAIATTSVDAVHTERPTWLAIDLHGPAVAAALRN